MMIFEAIAAQDPRAGFEQIVHCSDARVGLKAIIAMHSTALGPATGGCRMWAYGSEAEALTDVLRLSRGMTYKAAISGLNWGGGKAVIIGDAKTDKTPELLERFGEFVERLGGSYITAKDVGIGSDDLRVVKRRTRHVLGIDGEPGSSGDPSPATAWGVYHGLRSAVRHGLKVDSLKGVTVAIQGLGSVAFHLLEHLARDGVRVIGADIDPVAIERAVRKYGIEVVSPEAIYDVKCDVFSPSALGSSISADTLPRLKARVIAGGANNQLATPEMAEAVRARGITYAPDYAINAGGLINIYHEGMGGLAYDRARAFAHVEKIGDTIARILDRADRERVPPSAVADRMAEERIAQVRERGGSR